MRAMCIKVRARSANEGSGTVSWSLAALVPACFLMDEEDIVAPPGSLYKTRWGCTRSCVNGELKLWRFVLNHFVARRFAGLWQKALRQGIIEAAIVKLSEQGR